MADKKREGESPEEIFAQIDELLSKRAPFFVEIEALIPRLSRAKVASAPQLKELLDQSEALLLPNLSGEAKKSFQGKLKTVRSLVTRSRQSTGKSSQSNLRQAQDKAVQLSVYVHQVATDLLVEFTTTATGEPGALLAWLSWRFGGEEFFWPVLQGTLREFETRRKSYREGLEEQGRQLFSRAARLPDPVRKALGWSPLFPSFPSYRTAYRKAVWGYVGKPPAPLYKTAWSVPTNYKTVQACEQTFARITQWLEQIEALPAGVWVLIEKEAKSEATLGIDWNEAFSGGDSHQGGAGRQDRGEGNGFRVYTINLVEELTAKERAGVLGVSLEGLTLASLRSAYLRLAKQYHPDCSHDPGTEEKMKTLNECNDWLKKYLLRKEQAAQGMSA